MMLRPAIACLLLPVALLSAGPWGDPIVAGEADERAGKHKDPDAAAWKEWVDAFAKAEEVEFIVPRNRKGQSYKVDDPRILKAMAMEIAGNLEVIEREEWEEEFEIRIKGFQSKRKSAVWVSPGDAPGPDGYSGHLFVIGYGGGASASVCIREGTKVPVLSRVISEAGRSFGLRGLFGGAEEKKPGP